MPKFSYSVDQYWKVRKYYLTTDLSQQNIADIMKIPRKTILRWFADYRWCGLKRPVDK